MTNELIQEDFKRCIHILNTRNKGLADKFIAYEKYAQVGYKTLLGVPDDYLREENKQVENFITELLEERRKKINKRNREDIFLLIILSAILGVFLC